MGSQMKLKAILRTAQSAVPFIRPVKFEAYNLGTRLVGLPLEPEFRLLSKLERAVLALDIGGNWGQSIHALKRTAKPEGIIAFEPNPVLAARLKRRFAADRAVEIRCYALSNSEGEFNLYLPWYGNYPYDGLASLDYNEARGWFTQDTFAWFDPKKLRIETVVVKTRTLDSLDLAPDMVKVDVQGAEEMVVEGGVATFERCRPITIMESPTANIVNILSKFKLYAYFYHDGKLKDWKDRATNVVFMTDTQRRRLAL